jgi:two-component system chemotaxis sensor kinase CheA
MNEGPSLMHKLVKYLVLPKAISAFEDTYLRRMNRIGLVFFAIHVPVMMLLAWANATRPWLALVLSAAVVAGPAVAYATLRNPRTVSVVYGVAAMFMGGVLVHFGQGPVQIEMHFYFFALIAMLAVFGNPLVIVAAAVTVALHHLVLFLVLPRSVFNYDAPIWVVAVHAAFVVLESVAACFIARSFFDNVIGLEKIVQARTAELDARNRDMRLVLDNVDQGFLTIDRQGILSAERSRAFDRWFESLEVGDTLFTLLGRASREFGDQSRYCWDEVVLGLLPLELTLEQMPRDLRVGEKQYRVVYMPIGEGQRPERFLVVVTDVTAEVSRERAEQDRREAMILFERLLSDRTAVNDFFDDGAAMVESIASGTTSDVTTVKRMLHTLKGNSAIFGLESLSNLCHDIETRFVDENTLPPASDRARLRERWDALVGSLERLLGSKRRVIELDETEYAALEQGARRGAPSATLLAMVHSLKLEATQRRLDHFGEQIGRIATRLGKNVEVRTDSHSLRIDPKRWGSFWSAFIHAARNAVDHGLEAPDVRVSLGKPPVGSVALRTYRRGERFVVEIADDGRGIDWAGVARKAAELGLPSRTDADLRAALFHDGVSTAAHVTDISGRGIGMGAVRAATEALGGQLEIETASRQGTTLRMVFDASAMIADLGLASPATIAAA